MAGVIFRGLLRPLSVGGGGSQTLAATLTIDHTKCGVANTTDYPLLVRSTITNLKTIANGGLVANVNGYDIGFYSDAGLTTLLDFEIESWNATTGAIIAWVRVPTLSASVDTVVYVGAGDASIVASQQDAPGVWAGYGGVWHFGTGGVNFSASMRADSTGTSSNTLANPASSMPAGTGIVGDCLAISTTGVGGDTASPSGGTGGTNLSPTAAWTVEAWGKPTNTTPDRAIVCKGTGSNTNYRLGTTSSGKGFAQCSQGGAFRTVVGTSAISTSAFTHLVGTYDGATLTLYVNGASEGIPLAVTGATDNAGNVWIGSVDLTLIPWLGSIDEVRIASAARSASYVTATYNNISAPSTFYAVT
jgi:biopolymer transport protein ExbB